MSLVLWLPLDGNLHNYGISSVNFTNTVTFADGGKIGEKCLNSEIASFRVPEMDNKKQMSFAYWVKINVGTSTQWLDTITWYTTNGTDNQTCRQEFYSYDSDAEVMTTGVWYNGGSNSGLGSRKIGKWYHYAFTIDYNTGISRFYVNGTLWKTTTNINTSHYIRSDIANFRLRQSGLNSSINDFRLYDHILSKAEVKEISQGLFLHYKLNKNSPNIQDSSGYNHNGTIVGTITEVSNSARYSSALYSANGTSHYIQTPLLYMPTDAITFNIWFKTENKAPPSDYHILVDSVGNSSARQHYELALSKNGRARLGLFINGTRYVDNCTSTTGCNGQWHMTTLTYDGSTVKRYYDGILESSTNIEATTGLQPSATFRLFKDGYSTYAGKEIALSDFRIYATSLLDNDIKQLYNTSMKIDKSNNIHSFEINENNNNKINKQGQLECKEINEINFLAYVKNHSTNDWTTNQIIER